MATLYNMYEAKTNLSDLVERAVHGEEIVIAKAGIPQVRLVPIHPARVVREPGGLPGRIWVSPDFDDPLPEDELRRWEGRGQGGGIKPDLDS